MAPRNALGLSSGHPAGGTPVGHSLQGDPARSGEVRKNDPFLAHMRRFSFGSVLIAADTLPFSVGAVEIEAAEPTELLLITIPGLPEAWNSPGPATLS